MIKVIVTIIVGLAFLVAIMSVWIVPSGSKLWGLTYNGYDRRNPPAKNEWRITQKKYSVLLLFLGTLFTIATWMVAR